MAEMAHSEVAAMDTPALLALSLALASELSSRLASPSFLDELPRFPTGPERDRSDEWGLYADDRADDRADSSADGRPADPAGDAMDAGPAQDDASNEVLDEAPDAAADALPDEASIPPGALPAISVGVETLARSVDAARTALAGHTDRIFDQHDVRREVLGIPEGKCAFRNSHDYLREHLRIDRRDAKRRVERSAQVMASRTVDNSQELPPRLPVLADALHHADFDTSAADLVAETLTAARREAVLADTTPEIVDELLATGEQLLVAQAKDVDPGTLSRICKHWRQRFDAAVNPDGAEPTEAQMNAAQGLFYRGQGTGLHKWTIMAGDHQHEILRTIAAAASNPRAATRDSVCAAFGRTEGRDLLGEGDPQEGHPPKDRPGEEGERHEQGMTVGEDALADLETRSRGQKQLDGLVSALNGALALADAADLPASGGSRPQVLVTIDHDSLQAKTIEAASANSLISSAAYTGPIHPRTIRQWACDADLIPVVLGGEGQVLDVGRAQRLFTRKLRQAITARDGGCAAQGCSIPAPWCEAHHIDYWERGGATSVDNGVLLCSHHHHAVHADAWEISVRSGIPWFIPAPYLDPTRRPRRNKYWRPGNPDD